MTIGFLPSALADYSLGIRGGYRFWRWFWFWFWFWQAPEPFCVSIKEQTQDADSARIAHRTKNKKTPENPHQ